MAMAPRLEARQTQALVMTPQLQQAIKLLQLSNVELAQFIEEELERNPLLERDERDEASGEPRDVESAPRDESEHEVSLAGDGNDGDGAASGGQRQRRRRRAGGGPAGRLVAHRIWLGGGSLRT
jgi:RNA polymerase sigma-54 factor